MPPSPTMRYQTLPPGTWTVPSREVGDIGLVLDGRGVVTAPAVVAAQEEAGQEGEDRRAKGARRDLGHVALGVKLHEVDGRHTRILAEDEERLEQVDRVQPVSGRGRRAGSVTELQHVDVDGH